LLLVAKIDRRDRKLAVIANRTRQKTRSYEKLMRFLDSLEIPIIAVLRDSQNFLHAVDHGIGVPEMPRHRARQEIEQLDRVVKWLDEWRDRRRAAVTAERIPASPNLTVLHNRNIG
jgi:chromosome partitioning protein